MEQNETLEKDTVLALAIASGTSIADAAAKVGVGRTTVYRKLENPDFARLVCEFRDKLIAVALGRIADSLTRAADALAALLDAPEPHIRIRAARSLFSMGIRLRDSVDLTARMRMVEAELARKQGGTP
jgi:AcrR family transcriptional regulator